MRIEWRVMKCALRINRTSRFFGKLTSDENFNFFRPIKHHFIITRYVSRTSCDCSLIHIVRLGLYLVDLKSKKQQLQCSLDTAGRTAVLFLFLTALGLESPILVLVAISVAPYGYIRWRPTASRKQIRLNKICICNNAFGTQRSTRQIRLNAYNKTLLYFSH